MARTSVAVTPLTANGSISTAAGTTIDSTLVTNGVKIALASTAIPAAYDATRGFFLRVTNTNGTDRVCTVRKGASNPPAFQKDLGDLAVTVVATSGDVLIGPLDLARFVQTDGSIYVDFGTSMTGKITAYILPRTV